MKRTAQQVNYDRLAKVIDLDAVFDDENFDHGKSCLNSPGMMDLNYDRMELRRDVPLKRGEGDYDESIRYDEAIIAISHRYVQNGDSMADPDMQLRVRRFHGEYTQFSVVDPMTFQQDGFPGIGTLFQVVYPEPNKWRPKLHRELTAFLRQWLINLKNQGHRVEVIVEAA